MSQSYAIIPGKDNLAEFEKNINTMLSNGATIAGPLVVVAGQLGTREFYQPMWLTEPPIQDKKQPGRK